MHLEVHPLVGLAGKGYRERVEVFKPLALTMTVSAAADDAGYGGRVRKERSDWSPPAGSPHP